VLFVITTDGMENASREYTFEKIKSIIEKQKKKHNWEFLFLGANIDAIDVASRVGIPKTRATNFHNDSAGVALNYEALSETVSMYREEACLQVPDNWNAKISSDFLRRKSKA